mgnify:FL=1
MTDLPEFLTALDGTELFEIVAPGNAQTGLNYRITVTRLAALINGLLATATVVQTGATLLNPYVAPIFPPRFLFNKTVPSATYVNLQSSALYPSPILIRDIKGDADVNPIQITFSGAELADGLSSVTIATPYGGYWFNPLPTTYGNGFYIGTA